MPDPELAEVWFASAVRDLQGARAMVAENLGDLAVYHAQQCAEKAVKGLLAYHERTIEKTHAIHTLMQMALPVEPRLADWLLAAATLTDWGHDFRYPDDGLLLLPAAEIVEAALDYASEILGAIRAFIGDFRDAERP
jgi:HEPN domain-containing protein